MESVFFLNNTVPSPGLCSSGGYGGAQMSFIDWSDSDGIFGLLVEFVADECRECVADSERRRFLAHLLRDLTTIEERFSSISAARTIRMLKGVRSGITREFSGDPVVIHVEACIEELERLLEGGSA